MDSGSFITRDDAERALLEAVDWLGRLPDRERAYLSAGSRSGWPEVLREREAGLYEPGADYADGEGLGPRAGAGYQDVRPSGALSRRQMHRLSRLLLDQDCAAMAVPEGHRSLVGRVLVMMNWPGGEPFGWSRVWVAEGGRGCGVTSDALRARFDRAMGRVAARMEAMGLGVGGEG